MKLRDWFRSTPAVRLAPLVLGQTPELAAIHAQAFARPWSVMEFERLLSDRHSLGDGFFLGKTLMGFILSRAVLDEAEILTFAMALTARGRGYGGPLLSHHLEILTRRGARTVHLEVDEGNRAALALYRRFGFEETGRRISYYAAHDGTRSSALTMSLLL